MLGRVCVASALVAACLGATAAFAAPAGFDIALPRQPLAASLEAIGRRAHANIFFSPENIRGRTASSLKGSFTVAEALDRLLRGSGLGASVTPGGSYIISPRPPAPPRIAKKALPQVPSPPPPPDAAGAIVVTGSRIDARGFDAPTPIVHVSALALSMGMRQNVAAALNDLPQFRGTTSPQTTATNTQSGIAPVDLRGLGVNRTLVLLDGRRLSGDNDLNSVPTVLVKSIDVITGGSSAAWGSGAVAGVVNIAIDQDFRGLKLGTRSGISAYGDAADRAFEGAAGLSFADGRGSLVVGGDYLASAGIATKTARDRVGRWATVAVGNGQFRITPDVGFANAAVGGVILSGVLAGKAFNPDGSLRDFRTGTVVGNDMIGGEGPSNDTISPLIGPQRHYSGLAQMRFELSDRIRITAQIRHARVWGDHIWFGDNDRGDITISSDNAFLSSAIRSQLAAAGQTSFTMGRFNSDFPFPRIDYQRIATQGTLAIDGAFGRSWRWNAYYSHGLYRNDIATPGFVLTDNFAQAVDSVIDPATAQPVCRVTLTNPSSSCVPINLFGNGSPSAAALAYVTGTPRQHARTTLDVGGASLRGEPASLPAGTISIATGVELRREAIDQTVGELDSAQAFRAFNFSAYSGSYFVKEGFAEVLLPLVARSPVVRKLQLDAAARISDVDVTGRIWSWKLGLTGEIAPGLTLRVSRSRDIRSPNLSELFTRQTIGYYTISDPVKDASAYVLALGGGNRSLRSETAETSMIGLAFAPRSSTVRFSVDYYAIRVDNVISTLSPQDIVTRCFNGSAAMCARVVRDNAGNITRISTTNLNLARYRTNGVDADLSAAMPARTIVPSWPGDLTFRLSASWVEKLVTDDGASSFDYVGSQGNAFNSGVPKLRVNGTIGYETDGASIRLRTRFISAGKYNKAVNIINNDIPAYAYFDLQIRKTIASGKGPSRLEIYGDVSNLLNRKPPYQSLYSPYYDVVGRSITIGARIKI
ncbi:TonB-dependent receptor [Sphingomonas sp. AP4-R1]|uniref:TonB-dependent receptor n=1 Tax=Sphingomonas sp. AP4-R1 TaxID=2735134 RepID=UPI001493C43D|nr:TonB-dependent receptor [Sphingomonas sp. AP4-R1]QJU60154.1 TonB-dependent receptor [Sphingomonas sp. AP4-R1]